jgi:glycosyltransferase involved in cell wall biosynthesis
MARRRGPSRRTAPKKCVLIDGAKLLDPRMDGIKRYVQELLRAMLPIARDRKDGWEFHVRFGACGTFRLLDVAEDVEKGRPPLSRIHKLFRPDDENPINVYRRRLHESGARLSWDRLRDLAHYNYLKTIRSLHKRRHELGQLRERLSGSWTPLWFSENLSGYDLVHLTLPNTWSLYRRVDAPLLVTVHDLCHEVCPQFQNASNNRSLSAGLRFAAQADCDYIAVSQSTKDQMTKSLNVDPARVHVVHEACDDRRFRPVGRTAELRRVRSAYGIPEEPYLLSLCTLEPRKNLLGAVRAFNQLTDECPGLGANLVIAGSFGWGNSRELDEALRGHPRIHVIGHVEEADLPALYSGAAAFCYVSHYEGFGLPLVEAMSCGVPSVYGDVSSMPEIVKGAGLPADPDDVPQIKQRLRRLLEDDELRRRLAHRAVFRSLDFSWPKTAEETFACYARVLDARGAEAPAAEPREGGDLTAPASRIDTHGVGGRHAAA